MSDLLDITDDSNPLNIRKGNPGLKPSFTQNFRLFYNNYIQNHQRSIMAHVNFSTTSNSVSNMVTYNEVTGGRTTRPENINGNWNAFGMFMFNTAIDSAAFFNINTFTTLRYANNVGYVSVGNANSEKSTTRTTNLGERLSASYRNEWLEFELNGSVDYQHARSALQTNNNLDTWTFSYGANLMLTAPWGTQLSTNMNMNSRRGYNDAAMNTNELIWNAQLSHSFLRGHHQLRHVARRLSSEPLWRQGGSRGHGWSWRSRRSWRTRRLGWSWRRWTRWKPGRLRWWTPFLIQLYDYDDRTLC